MKRCLLAIALFAALTLAACSPGATPQLIGAYPRGGASGTTPRPPADLIVVYDAYLLLDVYDVERAADSALQIAYNNGGYLENSQTWFQDGRRYATLTLAVPVSQFDSARRELLRLGTLANETVSGDLIYTGPGGRPNYSHITVQLRPTGSAVTLPDLGWSPVRTFRSAFGVFFELFTFVLDGIIWLAVVIGPFALMALGVRGLARRWKRR